MLAIELGELIDLLPSEGFDVSVTGFETAEVDLLLADMATSRNEPAELIPSPPLNAVTERGDLWLLGKQRLLCGDAQQTNQLLLLMNGALAAAVFCDPPYNLRVSSIGGRSDPSPRVCLWLRRNAAAAISSVPVQGTFKWYPGSYFWEGFC